MWLIKNVWLIKSCFSADLILHEKAYTCSNTVWFQIQGLSLLRCGNLCPGANCLITVSYCLLPPGDESMFRIKWDQEYKTVWTVLSTYRVFNKYKLLLLFLVLPLLWLLSIYIKFFETELSFILITLRKSKKINIKMLNHQFIVINLEIS